MTERDFVVRDPVFFIGPLDTQWGCFGCVPCGVKNKKASATCGKIANAAGLDVFTGSSLRC